MHANAVISGVRTSVAPEYYASFSPLGSWRPLEEQEHYLFQVINVVRWKRVEVNLGAARA